MTTWISYERLYLCFYSVRSLFFFVDQPDPRYMYNFYNDLKKPSLNGNIVCCLTSTWFPGYCLPLIQPLIEWLFKRKETYTINAKACSKLLVRTRQHCVKCVQIRSFFWSVISCIRTEYRKIQTRANSVFGFFSRSVRRVAKQLPTQDLRSLGNYGKISKMDGGRAQYSFSFPEKKIWYQSSKLTSKQLSKFLSCKVLLDFLILFHYSIILLFHYIIFSYSTQNH